MTKTTLASVKELKSKKIDFSIFIHSGTVKSLEQAAQERNQSPDQVLRSLLFRLSDNDFALVLVAGPRQIPWKTIRRVFNQRRLTMASPEDVLKITGYKVGTVSPFGIPMNVPIYIDSQITGDKHYSIGSGESGTALILTAKELRKALPNATILTIF